MFNTRRPLTGSKKFWLIFALIGIGLFIWFFIRKETPIGEIFPQITISEELKTDKFEPASQIKSPNSGLWYGRDFTIDVLDEDLESEIDNNSCQYKVLSYDVNGTEHSTGWFNRRCNFMENITVGEGKFCSFEGEKSCWVFVRSQDKAGNFHLPAEEKGSVKYYHIDWSLPKVGKVLIENKEAKVSVSDNFKITGCNLYLDDENLGPMSFLVPGCQKECLASKTSNLLKLESGIHRLWAVCQDAAGNYGQGEKFLIKENLPPEISSCKVSPTQGNIQTNFQFKVEAADPDGDNLTFLWDFGDGKSSTEKNPSSVYSQTGTYEPKIKVFDGKGGEIFCLTAWVVVGE